MAVELGNISEQLFRVELHVDVVSQNLLEFLLFAPLKIKEKEKIYRAWYFLNRFCFFLSFRIGVREVGDTLPHTKLNLLVRINFPAYVS